MVHSASDKIQVTLLPALPATCVVCARSANGLVRFFDFQKDLDYYGAVVICEDCAKNMVDLLDFVPVAERDGLITELEIAQGELTVVRQENERVRNALDALIAVRPDLAPDSVGDPDSMEQELESSLDSGATENEGFDGSLASGGSEILFGSGSTD